MLKIKKPKMPKLLVSGMLAVGLLAAGTGYALLQPAPQSVNAATVCRYDGRLYGYDLTPDERQRYCTRKIQGILNSISWVQIVNGDSRRIYADWNKRLEVDGVFGSRTSASVERFQNWVGLDDDGIVGPNTWSKLCNPPQPMRVQVAFAYLEEGGYERGACY